MGYEDRKKRFAEAFPWWAEGKERHGWQLTVETHPGAEEVRRGGILMALKHDPSKDSGSIRIYMPGATKEQEDAVIAWATAEYSPMLGSAPQERE